MDIPCLLLVLFCFSNVVAEYSVRLVGDTLVVLGGTLQLRAEVFDSGGVFAQGQFRYTWDDNAIPEHNVVKESTNPICEWNLTYNPELYGPGPYNVQVRVERKILFFGYQEIASQRLAVSVTALLSGDLVITQGEAARQQYVAANFTAKHNITLTEADMVYLSQQKPHISTFWFYDCQYMGVQSGLLRNFNYSGVDTTHYVEALVVASPMPPTPPTTTTTTTTPATTTSTTTTTTTSTTSTTTTSTTSTTTTTTPKPQPTIAMVTTASPNVTSSPAPVELDAWHQWLEDFGDKNKTIAEGGFCVNMTAVPMSPNSTYGYFRKKLVAKESVRLLNINGSNWLQNGDMLNLQINCNGSGPFSYCVQLSNGAYNVTGNETCAKDKARVLPECSLIFQHFFHAPEQYTLVFIISNSVSKLITPVGVNVYKVTKQPQLSVIIVPVASSIVAVILIVFGVAYYIHSKRSFNVEVADFDFGQQHSELEYKTFSERLRESIINSFFRTNDPVDSEGGWSPSRKYGSMQ